MNAITLPATGRRMLLGGAAALLSCTSATSGGLAAVTPDADLIADCQAFDAIERRVKACFGDHRLGDGAPRIDDENERDRIVGALEDQQKAMLDRIVDTRATTLEGVVARARTLTLWAPDLADDLEDRDYNDTRMLAALLRDLVALGDGGPHAPAGSARMLEVA